jgi:hypothetical protein
MSGTSNPNDDIIRHQQERDHAEAEAERARASRTGTRDLGKVEGEDAPADRREEATSERGLNPTHGRRTQ